MSFDQLSRMRVKTAELKTHLSRYLKSVRDSGEPIEVCVREEAVAYLVPVERGMKAKHQAAKELEGLGERLRGSGITLTSAPVATGRLPEIRPAMAGDGRTDISSVSEIRRSNDW